MQLLAYHLRASLYRIAPPSEDCEGRTGLAGSVQTKHQQAHFLAAEDLGQRARECGAHGGGSALGRAATRWGGLGGPCGRMALRWMRRCWWRPVYRNGWLETGRSSCGIVVVQIVASPRCIQCSSCMQLPVLQCKCSPWICNLQCYSSLSFTPA